MMPANWLSKKIFLVSLVLLYRVTLDWSYVTVLEPYFMHLGFVLNWSLSRLLESYFLTVVASLLLPASIRRPSDLLVFLLFVISVCPTMSVYALRGGSELFAWMAIAAFAMVSICRQGKRLIVPRMREGRFLGLSAAVFGTALVTIWLIASGGLNYFNLDLLNVYQYREVVRSELYSGLFGYLNQWAFRIFNVTLIAVALHKRNWFFFVCLLGLQVFFFGISSEKKVLFVPLLVLLLYGLHKTKYSPQMLMIAGIFGVAAATWAAQLFDQVLPFSLSVRRMLFTPATLNFAYHEFFGAAGHVLWSTGPLSFLFEYPYEETPALMISYHMRGTTDIWMNNGFLGASYMHFGYIGMLFFGAIIGFLARIVDSLVIDRLPMWLGLSIVIVPFFNMFTGADLTTAFGTHGLGVGLVILWLIGLESNRRSGTRIRAIQSSST